MTLDLLIAVIADGQCGASSSPSLVLSIPASDPAENRNRGGSDGLVLRGGRAGGDRDRRPERTWNAWPLALAVVIPIVVVAILAARDGAISGCPLRHPRSHLDRRQRRPRLRHTSLSSITRAGRLPAPFAPSAGWGDVLVGVLALPVALMAARRAAGWRPIALLWNIVGDRRSGGGDRLRRDLGRRLAVPDLHRGSRHAPDGGAADVPDPGIPGAALRADAPRRLRADWRRRRGGAGAGWRAA